MRALVTGGAGFIGSNFILKKNKHFEKIYCVDNLNDLVYANRFKNANLKKISQLNNVEIAVVDLSTEVLTDFFYDVDVIINFAALPGQILSWNYFTNYFSANTNLVLNILERMVKLNKRTPLFIQASTSSVYGRESVAKVGMECDPENPYGITKLFAEKLVEFFGSKYELDYVILRFFSVYGPSQREDMAIHKFLSRIMKNREITVFGDGNQTRDLTYVDTAVDAVFHSITNPKVKKQTFNVSDGQIYSITEIINACEKIIGRSAKLKFEKKRVGDQLHTKAIDIERTTDFLKLEHTIDLFAGIENQAKHLKEFNNV